jgi:hypothetical protein
MIPHPNPTTYEQMRENKRYLDRVFYRPRQIAPAQVPSPSEEAVENIVQPITLVEPEGSPEFLEQLREWLALSATPALANHVTARQIVRECAERHGCTMNDIIGGNRKKNLVQARHEAMAAVYVALSPVWSLPKIGNFFGGRHHTTVMHAAKKMKVWKGGEE